MTGKTLQLGIALAAFAAHAFGQSPPPPRVLPPRPVVGQPAGPPAGAEARPRPVIERIEPASGPVGTVVVVVGRNFQPGDRVTLAGIALEVREVVPTRISVVIPQGARSGRLVVHGSAVVESAQTFNVVQPPPPPRVTGLDPPAAPPGTDVAIHGENFSIRIYENTVSLAGLVIPVRTASPTQLTVTIPEGAQSGSVVVTVSNAGQAQAPAPFEVLAPLRIDRVDPDAAPVGGRVRIVGSGFDPTVAGNTVKLGDRACPVLSASGTVIEVEVPARARTGNFIVSVAGRGELLSPSFRVVYPPVLRSFAPTAGFPGTEVTLRGDDLGESIAATRVTMSGVAMPVAAVTPSEVRVRVPEGASTGLIQLEVEGAGATATSRVFEVWTPLGIVSVHPQRGIPGTSVRVVGRGFLPDRRSTTVTIGGRAAGVESVTDTQIVFKVPDSASTGRIRISVRGRGEIESPSDFVVLAAPRITRVAPDRVPPGGEVTIAGENFGDSIADVTVAFGGIECPVRSMSSTQVVVVMPAGVDRGRFVVSIRGVGEAQSDHYRAGAPPPAPTTPPPAVVSESRAPAAPAPVAPAPPAAPRPPPPAVIVH